MNEYIQNWLEIIENMNNDNTYKLAWGRALIELAIECKSQEDYITFSFYDIGHKMLKYYWNQIFFFDLKQSANKKPVIVTETEKCIAYVCDMRHSKIPIWFDKAEGILKENSQFYTSELTKIARKLRDDVSHRFMNGGKDKGKIPLYQLDLENLTVTFKQAEIQDLKEFGFVLSQLLNYRWAQLLEKFNSSPRIALKVKGISDAKIRRNNLTKFKNILIENMRDKEVTDFYTGDILNDNDISVDHVIPWSFMYSDDIWNLVIMDKSGNSSKSNSVPTEETIKRLEERNIKLLSILEEEIKNNPHKQGLQKYRNDLKEAIENDYVQKFYLAMKL